MGKGKWVISCLSGFLSAAFLGQASAATAEAHYRPVGSWEFNGSLDDKGGYGLHAVTAREAEFVPSPGGQALRLAGRSATIADSPVLRLAQGLLIETRVRFDSLPEGSAFTDVVMKGNYGSGEYVLRVNPVSEGRQFGFFVNTGKWEPRVNSGAAVSLGVWYDLAAGWDARGMWLSVNNETTRVARAGQPVTTWEPLRIGPFDGAMERLLIQQQGGGVQGVGFWPFDGEALDSTRHGRDWQGASGAAYVAVPGGQALKADAAVLTLPSHPDLQLAPGFRLDCAVLFDEIPDVITPVVVKEGEYMLRLDPSGEGGRLSFFLNIDGWEPRVSSLQSVKTGVWHQVSARWNGFDMTLDVNGEQTKRARAGVSRTGSGPLKLGRFRGAIDNLHIENPKPIVVQLRGLTADRALLRAGQTVRVSGQVFNGGSSVTGGVVAISLPEGVTCESPESIKLEPLVAAVPQTVEWKLRANTGQVAIAAFRLSAGGADVHHAHKALVFFDVDDTARSARVWNPPPRPDGIKAATYYVDSKGGDNANTGISPESAWRDFTPVNGRTLGPGERVLLRRGSVFNQELKLSARGTPEAWAEIGTYGEGARPVIRRNWDIAERCVLIDSPDYLAVRGLTVCFAGKGLIVHYARGGHRGLLIEDCVAHHIEGLYRFNSHGIPEWLNREGAPGDGMNSSAGFAVSGAAASALVFRDCEMFQCSWGFRFSGEDVTVDRIFCHDNFVHNTSPHPALTSIRRSYLQNSIFDAAGWHAFAGTMGIMLVGQDGLIIRNCHFLNQPDSGSHDQGGVDFEARGDGCLIDRCTFRNNAGAAIEVLGLKSPQARNIEIANSRFIRNNVAHKLGPSEIFIWGANRDPEVCCSTGIIRDNGYVLHPGVLFFTNQAPALTSWSLSNNTEYASEAALKRALPLNDPPLVEAGSELWTDRLAVRLKGRVSDDGLPGDTRLRVRWELLHGPGEVDFLESESAETEARFSEPGDYQLRLVADDGELWRSALTTVHVLRPGIAVERAWTFATPLDKEGWSDWDLGTRDKEWFDQPWPCVSRPVKHVAGGFYIVAVEESAEAHLLSPDTLGICLSATPTFAIRMQNRTSATRLRLRFTTVDTPEWEAGHGTLFAVTPNDNETRLYTVEMRGVEGWDGCLKQLRLELSDGTPVTGTCRIDYIWLGGPVRQPWWRRWF